MSAKEKVEKADTADTSSKANYRRQKLMDYIFYAWLGVGVLDYLNSAVIYLFYFLRDVVFPVLSAMRTLIIETLRMILFPITMCAAVLYAVFVWGFVFMDRKPDGKPKLEHQIRAAYNTTMAILAIAGTVAGLVILGPTAAICTVIIYGISLSISAGYNFSGTGYHISKGRAAEKKIKSLNKHKHKNDIDLEMIDELEKEKKARYDKAMPHMVVGVTSILIAIAGFCVGTLGFPPLAFLGIAAGLAGAVFFGVAIVKIWLEQRAIKKKEKLAALVEPVVDDNLPMQNTDQVVNAKLLSAPTSEREPVISVKPVKKPREHRLVPSVGILFDHQDRVTRKPKKPKPPLKKMQEDAMRSESEGMHVAPEIDLSRLERAGARVA